MKYSIYLLYFSVVFLKYTCHINAAAIPKAAEEQKHEEVKPEEAGDDWEMNLEYGRYLKEIVQALESDPEFRKKLEGADAEDVKSGKIARELHFVDHSIRTKLDELKRQELERLRHLAVKEHEKQTGVDRSKLKMPVHIDLGSPNRFEVEDLRKLIIQTTKDLEEADKQRREEFKKYEMEKDFQFNQSLKSVDESQKEELIKKHEEEKKKHAEHGKLKHPGSKQQLEEVWQEQDHMNVDDFDPKVFFHLHDLDGNNYWDQTEVKALFKLELDKLYNANAPEDDINEKYEEMERMREHVFRETDRDRDGLISYEEFLEQAQKSEFEQDEGWQGLDEQQVFSDQEYAEYERKRQEELHRLIQEGKVDPNANINPPPSPIAGQDAGHIIGNQGIPQNAVPQVSQHLDAVPAQQQNQQHPPVLQQQHPPVPQQQQQHGVPPNIAAQQPPQVIHNVPGVH